MSWLILGIDAWKNTGIQALVSQYKKEYRFLKGVLRALIIRG
ncbi:hypothetical protein [Methanospirillum sp.]